MNSSVEDKNDLEEQWKRAGMKNVCETNQLSVVFSGWTSKKTAMGY